VLDLLPAAKLLLLLLALEAWRLPPRLQLHPLAPRHHYCPSAGGRLLLLLLPPVV
jgi:hypothetical protein